MALRTGINDIMKEGSSMLSGVEEALIKNVDACAKLMEVGQTSLGPNGMNKMVINHLEKLFVTSDAATILSELEVQHPAAKLIANASKMQDDELGDATNLVTVFAGSVLLACKDLLLMGLHPSEISSSLRVSLKKLISLCDEIPQLSLRPNNDALNILKAPISAKQHAFQSTLLPLVLEACESIKTKFEPERVRITKVVGGSINDSEFISGMVINRIPEGSITEVNNAKIAIFTCPFVGSQAETKGNVLVQNADDLLNFSKTEEDELACIVKGLSQSGINVVICGSSVSDLALHYFEANAILCLKVLSKFELLRLSKSLSGIPLSRIGIPTNEELGICQSVCVQEIANKRMTIFRPRNDDSFSFVSILLRGPTDNILDDIERAINDSLNVFKQSLHHNNFINGAGFAEMFMGTQISKWAASLLGLEKFVCLKFATALETVPKSILENSGMNSISILSEFRHCVLIREVAIDVERRCLSSCDELKIYDSLYIKKQALRIATEVAQLVLKADQIIMAKPAGGPKPPQQPTRD